MGASVVLIIYINNDVRGIMIFFFPGRLGLMWNYTDKRMNRQTGEAVAVAYLPKTNVKYEFILSTSSYLYSQLLRAAFQIASRHVQFN